MKQFLPFLKDTEIFRWGPIPGRYFYVSEFEDVIFEKYPNLYEGDRWPNTLFLFKSKRMVWINDFNELRESGKNVFLKYMMSEAVRTDLKNQWVGAVKELSSFERRLEEKFFSDLADDELYGLWQEFYNLIIAFWLPTVPCELGNYGSADLLSDKLKKYIKDASELSSAMEILTAPEAYSFYQEEEIDLAKTKDLEKHAKKYFWLRNSYNGVETLPIDFFSKRKNELALDIEQLMEERLKGAKNKKRKVILKYKLPKAVKDIANALCEGVAWQDERKKHIFIYIYYKEMFLKEISRRFKYNIDDLKNCSSKEIMEVLKKKGLHATLQQRGGLFGFFMNPYQKELTGEEAVFCWDNYAEEKVEGKMTEITGIVASSGPESVVRGEVKIISDPSESKDFKEGNILVAAMTSPEFVFLMKKSKAVITDAGGLTSHAAIVSRELNIPCIVGTRAATKVLKDGDIVEVDTNKGLVKIINK